MTGPGRISRRWRGLQGLKDSGRWNLSHPCPVYAIRHEIRGPRESWSQKREEEKEVKGMIATMAVLIAVALALAACGGKAAPAPNMPNPASVFCEENGGKVEIRTAADGSQQGFCVFTDGTECDEWAYYRAECAPGTPKP
jgi:putative hemolysin